MILSFTFKFKWCLCFLWEIFFFYIQILNQIFWNMRILLIICCCQMIWDKYTVRAWFFSFGEVYILDDSYCNPVMWSYCCCCCCLALETMWLKSKWWAQALKSTWDREISIFSHVEDWYIASIISLSFIQQLLLC